jgi:hypothetical protein
MCIWTNPDKEKLQISLEDLEMLYDHIHGPLVERSNPQPSLAGLRTMERKVWWNINLLLHSQDVTLKEAIQKTVDNHLFWMTELTLCRQQPEYRQSAPTTPTRSKKRPRSQTPNNTWQQRQPSQQKGQQNKGSGKGTGKSKSKDSGKQQPKPSKGTKRFADVNTKNGKAICVDWQWGKCKTNCGKSHVCSVLKPDGTACLANHTAKDHK